MCNHSGRTFGGQRNSPGGQSYWGKKASHIHNIESLQDLCITGSIATALYQSRTGWKRTDGVIMKLLLLVAETQLPPTIFALILAVQWAAQQNGVL